MKDHEGRLQVSSGFEDQNNAVVRTYVRVEPPFVREAILCESSLPSAGFPAAGRTVRIALLPAFIRGFLMF